MDKFMEDKTFNDFIKQFNYLIEESALQLPLYQYEILKILVDNKFMEVK